jgi:hypothetical protein
MQEELAQLETSRSALSERLVRTEASERSRMPSVQVIEAASAPGEAWRPDYPRDAGISIAVALGLALATMSVVELFNRPPARSMAPVIVPQSWITLHDLPAALAGGPAFRPLPQSAVATALLPGATEASRELSQPEVAALLHTMPETDVVWAGLLLCGATADEIRSVAAADLDSAHASIRLQGACARALPAPAALFARVEAAFANPGREGNASIDMPVSDDELKRRLLCAAHDAGLDDPAGVTPLVLRHTCIAHLVRQGLRFSDLDRIVGALPADALAGYAGLSPAGVRRTRDEISPWMPALEALDAAWT